MVLPVYWRGFPYIADLREPHLQYDFDGLYSAWGKGRSEGRTPNYTHLGRGGLVEVAMMNGLYPDGPTDKADRWNAENKRFGGLTEYFFGEAWWEESEQQSLWLSAISRALELLEFHPPFFLSLAFLNAQKVQINNRATSKRHLRFPAIMVEGPKIDPEILRPLFDMLMNAYEMDSAAWPV